jgi:hypothetical protein
VDGFFLCRNILVNSLLLLVGFALVGLAVLVLEDFLFDVARVLSGFTFL